MYLQIIKQLTENQSSSKDSVEKGWQLMEFCLQTFSPSDDFGNYLEIYLREKAPDQKLLHMLHDTQFGTKRSAAPNVDELVEASQKKYTPKIVTVAPPPVLAAIPQELVGGLLPPSDLPLPPTPEEIEALNPEVDDGGGDGGETPEENAESGGGDYEVICRVLALYDYDAEDETELTIRENDVVNVLNQDDEGWWLGELNGATGTFPSNYVEAYNG